jgi:hypothetical protein
MTTAAARLLPFLLLMGAAPGCGLLFGGSPSKVNIDLRKENATLREQIKAMEAKKAADQRVIEGMREQSPTLPTLSPDRLAKLFTTHGLKLGRLTGGWDGTASQPGDEGLAVYAAPLDEAGDALKAAGSFVVEAFDLADAGSTRVGRWEFDLAATRRAWRSALLDYTYVLECPWQGRVPANAELTLKVTFVDELTQVPFHAQQTVKFRPAPASGPASNAATRATTQPSEPPPDRSNALSPNGATQP